MKTEKYFFRIKKSEQGKYSTAGITLDENLVDKYTPETVERAKELKAKNQNSKQNFSDEYYLNYAKSLQLQDITGALNKIHHNRLAGLEIQDKDWAEYSYEEIIEMENQGFKIPEEVLLWAHAQQQADVTDYIIVSDSSNLETTNTINGNDELQNLQKKAKENINKAEKAKKTAETKTAEFTKVTKNAKNIKKAKQEKYKKAMEETESMAKEWKELDDKKKNGKLNFAERVKYKSLSKKLNGKDNEGGTRTKAIEADNAILDEFLTSLDGLKNDINENLELAQNTIQSGRDLSEYKQNYPIEKLPQVMSGIRINDMGASSDELYGAKTHNIADIAIETGDELKLVTNEISVNLESDKNIELSDFAKDYTTLAQETLTNTQNIINGNQENDEENQEKDKKETSKLNSYSVDVNFTAQNSKKAIITTLNSTADLYSHKNAITKEENTLQKELKQTSKDIQNIQKESQKVEKKQQENTQKENILIAELKTIQGQAEQEPIEEEKITEPNNIPKTKTKKQEKDNLPILEELENINNENTNSKAKVSKALIQGLKSDAKSQKISKDLTTENSSLATRTKNAKKVATDTTIVGVGTFSKGFITTVIGNAMYATGMTMIATPMTYGAGLALAIAGKMLQIQGANELTYGLGATVTGTIGYAATLEAAETNSETKNSIKHSLTAFKANKKVFQETNKNDSEETSIQQTTENNTTQNSENTEELPVSIDENETTNKQDTENQPANETENQNIEQNTQTITDETTTEPNKATEATETTEETDETDETQPKEQDENQENKQENTYTVSSEISAINAIKAAQTTRHATAEIRNYNTEVNGLQNDVTSQVKKSKSILQNIEIKTKQAENKHQTNVQKTNEIKESFESTKLQMDNVETQDQLMSTQGELENISAEYTTAITEDSDVFSDSQKIISSNTLQLDKFKTNIKTLNNEITTFDKKTVKQIEISNRTINVGIGTNTLGILDTTDGTRLIVSGTALMATPLTFSIGLTQTILGGIKVAKGSLEIATGTNAIVEGYNGKNANNQAKDTLKASQNTEKIANKEYKENDKQLQEIQNNLNPEEGIFKVLEQPKTKEINDQEDQDEQQELTRTENKLQEEVAQAELQLRKIQDNETQEQAENQTSIAASVNANANINNEITTDDKVDRKLSKFNMESMIESKKKLQRVQAISASARNRK